MMFDRIVLATDGSASVRRCIETAVDLAERADATLHAVYVGASPGDALATVEAATTQAVETATLTGDPAAAIVSYAVAHDADVIALGTRGRHGAHRFLLGSVAEAVVEESPVPVLTVRQQRT